MGSGGEEDVRKRNLVKEDIFEIASMFFYITTYRMDTSFSAMTATSSDLLLAALDLRMKARGQEIHVFLLQQGGRSDQ